MGTQEQIVKIQDDDPYILFQLPLENFNFNGENLTERHPLTITSDTLFLTGAFSDGTSNILTNLEAQNLSYKTPALAFTDATLKIDDFAQESSHTQIHAKNMSLPNLPLLSNPFELTLNTIGAQTSAQLKFDNTPILMQLDGQLSIPQKNFWGQIQTNIFDLKDVTIPIQKLWPNLPANITNLSGLVRVFGQLAWRGPYNVTGPLNVALKDLSFDINNTAISGLNTVLTLNSVRPLSTNDVQHVFVQSIDAFIPFQNLDMTFQVDPQNVRLNRLSVSTANIPLSLPPSVIPVKNANMLTYLKNDLPINLTDLQQNITLDDLSMASGTANITMPIEFINGALSLSNITLKMQNAWLKREGDDYASFFGDATAYFIRTGQVIMDKNKIIQLALNGRLRPSNVAKDINKNDIQLPASFFQPIQPQTPPQDIQQRLDSIFKH